MQDQSPVLPGGSETETLESLSQSHQSLRGLVLLVVAILILFTAGVNIFILRQVASAQRQVADLRQYLADYQTNSIPAMNKFMTDIQAFTRANPDFAPILGKYQKSAATPPAAVLPPGARPPSK